MPAMLPDRCVVVRGACVIPATGQPSETESRPSDLPPVLLRLIDTACLRCNDGRSIEDRR
jgi:hypothetical protein